MEQQQQNVKSSTNKKILKFQTTRKWEKLKTKENVKSSNSKKITKARPHGIDIKSNDKKMTKKKLKSKYKKINKCSTHMIDSET